MSIITELKRRNVIRMAGLYLVGAWLVTQVAATLLPVFEAPAWVMKALLGVLAIGFFGALVFAWVFELTADGLKRDADVTPEHSIAPQTAQRMERMILLLLALALGFFAFDKFVLAPRREAALVAATAQAARAGAGKASTPAISDKSIAVLPFVDMSQAKDQEWFGDGLAEEVLNALVKTPDLQVSARTSSFRYKGSKLAVPQIARELGVAHVLEGSIRSTPQRIRVTAQLIRASDGFHLWSQTFDRDPADMIEIQENLARNIATAMQTTMDPKALADMARVGTRSVEAYQAYLRGQASEASINAGVEVFRTAYAYFERAREHDPEFAAAHAEAAGYWSSQLTVVNMGFGLESLTQRDMESKYQERMLRAIATAKSPLDRKLYEAAHAEFEMRWRDAIALLLEVQAKRPGDRQLARALTELAIYVSDHELMERQLAMLWPHALKDIDDASTYANNAYRTRNFRRAADHAMQLQDRWAGDFNIQYQIHRSLLWDRRVEPAAIVLARVNQLAGSGLDDLHDLARARQACAEGRREEVEPLLAKQTQVDSTHWLLLGMLGRDVEATELLMALERKGRTFALAGFLNFPNFDPTPFPSLMRVLEREQVKRPPPVPLPFACKRRGATP
jgi:TolB-like protein